MQIRCRLQAFCPSLYMFEANGYNSSLFCLLFVDPVSASARSDQMASKASWMLLLSTSLNHKLLHHRLQMSSQLTKICPSNRLYEQDQRHVSSSMLPRHQIQRFSSSSMC